MAFDGIVLNCVVNELRTTLLNAKVNKIFEPTKNEIIIGFYQPPHHIALLLNIQPETARIHCTTHSKPNPFQAPNFCMLLRKHLMGARLVAIHTFDLERIVELVFETFNELKDKVTKKLMVEVMASHSNIILTNHNNIIIDSLHHVSNGQLEIMPARTYSLPTNPKHSFLAVQNFSEFMKFIPQNSNDPIDKILSDTFIGISRSFVQNLLASLGTTDLEVLYSSMKQILEHISEITLQETPDKKDYKILLSSNIEPLEVNFFLDDYYTKKEEKTAFLQKRNQLLAVISSQLKKYTKRLENINGKLQECKDMEQYRIWGELITSNLYRFAPHTNLETITVENYYENQKQITIPLDKRFSLSKNAEKYFKKYNKLKNTLQIVSLQKRETEIELEYIQSLLFSIENSNTIEELIDIDTEITETGLLNRNDKIKQPTKIQKTANLSQPLEFTIDGYTVFAGKNNKQNDFLTLKMANKQDLWFHVQNVQGSHVILKTEGKPVSDDIILKCATIAAQNSKAKNSTHVAVDYCPVKNVKKPSGSKPRYGYLSKL